MNIQKREWKAGLRSFLFWTLGLVVLILGGVIKSTGLAAGGESIAQLTRQFPRIVLAVLGMADVDISTFAGFYAVLAQYTILLTAVFAVSLGCGCVCRESVDKTYEFVFTKPRTRSFILAQKILVGISYLALYCVMIPLLSLLGVAILGRNEGDGSLFFRFGAAAFLVGLVFFSLGALFSSLARNTENGAKFGNGSVFGFYFLGVLYTMLEHPGALRLLTPFQFFPSADLIGGNFSALYAGIFLAVFALCMAGTFIRFEKRDLGAA